MATGGDKVTIGDGEGFFVVPTVFVNVAEDARIRREEIFGPVVVIRPFDDEADAIRSANDTTCGLRHTALVLLSSPGTSRRLTVWLLLWSLAWCG